MLGRVRASDETKRLLLRVVILALIYALAFASRLFSIVNFESVIHEFDPYFNYRATLKLVADGPVAFHNWFDSTAWYPLGRAVGGTVYPGLMWTAGLLYTLLHRLTATVAIRNVCVLLAPFFAGNTTLVTYFLAKGTPPPLPPPPPSRAHAHAAHAPASRAPH